MKTFFELFFVLLIGTTIFSAQEKDTLNSWEGKEDCTVLKKISPLTKQGQMFIFFGWNRSAYSNSDIHFKGNGYDFQLDNVKATDRPTKLSWDYINPAWFTVVQYDFRAGYFIKDDLALVLGIDHMKYVMKQNQTVDFSGTISDPKYAAMILNGQVNLADKNFSPLNIPTD